MTGDMIRALKAILSEGKRDFNERVNILPAVQWALDTAFCGGCEYTLRSMV